MGLRLVAQPDQANDILVTNSAEYLQLSAELGELYLYDK